MNLAEISSKYPLPDFGALRESALWRRRLDKIPSVIWDILYRRLIAACGLSEANRIFRLFKSEALSLYLIGEINDCPLLSFALREADTPAPVLIELIDRFEHNERCMIMFALSEEITLKQAILIKWDELPGLSISALGCRILDHTIRHFKFGYCFWQYGVKNQPLPLIGFETRFRRVTDLGWDEFVAKAKRVVVATDENKEKIDFFLTEWSKR